MSPRLVWAWVFGVLLLGPPVIVLFIPMTVTSHQSYSGEVALVEYFPTNGAFLFTHNQAQVTFYSGETVSCVVPSIYQYLSEYKPLVNQTVTIRAVTWPGLWLTPYFVSVCTIGGNQS